MPCDSIRTVSVDLSALGKIDIGLLCAALNDLGLRAQVHGEADKRYITTGDGGQYYNGQLTMSQYSRVTVDNVKAAYSKQVVISQCKRYGWAYKESKNAAGQVEFAVTKR